MMKRFLAALLAVLLLWPALPASAEGTLAYITQLQGDEYRVKLRAKPSTGGKVIGQYFTDVAVTVLADEGKWSQVSIGGREGWMMSEFLEPAAEGDWHWEGHPGAIPFPEADGCVPLYDAPAKGAAEIARISADQRVHVLGTIGEDWLHVLWPFEDGSRVYGYVSSADVAQSDNFATLTVDSGDAARRVNVREAPSAGAREIGEYWSGTLLYQLYDNHVAEDGWQRVRLGSVVGYIRSDFLDDSDGWVFAHRPPLVQLKKESAPLYADAKGKEIIGEVTSDDEISVAGIFGSRYQVRIAARAPGEYRYGMIDKSAVKRAPKRSASTAARVTRDVPLYKQDEHGQFIQRETLLPKGTKVSVYRTYGADGTELSEYVGGDAVWMLVEAELRDEEGQRDWTSGYVPVDALKLDEGLRK